MREVEPDNYTDTASEKDLESLKQLVTASRHVKPGKKKKKHVFRSVAAILHT